MWLWSDRDDHVFDYGYREGDFVPFETPAQFTPGVERHALRAAERILELRAQFTSVADVKTCLMARRPRNDRRLYHAAVACGLTGERELARELFAEFDEWLKPFESGAAKRKLAAELVELLDDLQLFRDRVVELIVRCRVKLRLTPERDRVQDQLSIAVRR